MIYTVKSVRKGWSTFFLILMTAIGGSPWPEFLLLAGAAEVNALAKKRYSNSFSGRGSNSQPSNWWADTLPLTFHYEVIVAMNGEIIMQQQILWLLLNSDIRCTCEQHTASPSGSAWKEFLPTFSLRFHLPRVLLTQTHCSAFRWSWFFKYYTTQI